MKYLKRLWCRVVGCKHSDKYAITRGLSRLSGLPPICLRCHKTLEKEQSE